MSKKKALSFNQFIKRFPTEESCEEYLFQLKWLHRIIGNAKVFINGTYHGTSTKHMQMHLSEFCYRFNRRSFNGAIFDRLLVAIVG